MKRKIVVIILTVCCLFFFPIPLVYARAGGATGGGNTTGGGGTGTTTSDYGTHYGRYRGGYYYGRPSPISDFIFASIFVGLVGYQFFTHFRNQRQKELALHGTYPIDDQLADQFSELFYQVENAWTQTDKSTLAQLMTPQYYTKQAKIIDNWRARGKINRLESIAIVSLKRESNDSKERPKIVVTAQARDWFEYPAKSADFNQTQHDDAFISRFTEVWEIIPQTNQLLVDNIRQISDS